MGYAQVGQTIHAPLEAVWNALNDIDNTPKWVVGLEKAEVKTHEPYGQDTVYYDYNRLGPFPQVTAWTVVEFEPMSYQVHVSSSNVLPSKMLLSLVPTAEGTDVTMTVEYRFMPQWRAVGRLFERMVMNHLLRSVLKQNLGQLERYLQRQETQTSIVGKAFSHGGKL
jgi:uncharacterized protein YndB with AHSA1/START domain